MPAKKMLSAPALILTAAGLALIAIATILALESRPILPPAGSEASGGPVGDAIPVARAGIAHALAG